MPWHIACHVRTEFLTKTPLCSVAGRSWQLDAELFRRSGEDFELLHLVEHLFTGARTMLLLEGLLLRRIGEVLVAHE